MTSPLQHAGPTTGPVRLRAAFLALEGLDADTFERLKAELLPAEKARIARLPLSHLQQQKIAGAMLARTLLAETLDADPRTVGISHDALGAPVAMHRDIPAPVYFSRTQTSGMVAACIATGARCGIDVERIKADAADRDLARHLFSPGEQAHLAAFPAQAATEAFFRIWTLKEAYIKARGLGFRLDLQGFSLISSNGTVHFDAPADDDPARWSFLSQLLAPGHCLAVAAETGALDVTVQQAFIDPGKSRVRFGAAGQQR